jgi:hypothetical protein
MSDDERARLTPLVPRLLGDFVVVVEACLFAVMVVLVANGFDPDFRGGWFLKATLLIAVALVTAVLVRDVIRVAARQELDSGSPFVDAVQFDGTEADQEDWRTIGIIILTVAALFLSLFMFGIPVGTTIACWVILKWKLRLSMGGALFGAVMLGIVVPVPFAYVLGLNMWPGVIPQIIPDWVGGGLPPPL